MLRIISLIVVLGAFIAGILWLSDNPGNIVLNWLGYEISAPIIVVIIAAFLGISALILFITTIARLFDIPVAMRFKSHQNKQKKGIEELTLAIASMASGDTSLAEKHTKKVEKIFGELPLTHMIKAQTSYKKGNIEATTNSLKKMLDNKPTSFMAAKALSNLSLKNDDIDEAITYAEKANNINPKNCWGDDSLFTLYLKTNRWVEAERIIINAKSRKHLTKEEANRKLAILYYFKAEYHKATGQNDKIEVLLTGAHKHAADLIPASLALASKYESLNKRQKALNVIYRNWKLSPNAALQSKIMDIIADEPDKKRIKRIKTLTKHNPQHIESLIALAHIHNETSDRNAARTFLEAALKIDKQARIYRLLADIEQKEGNMQAATEMLTKAANASPDPAWSCKSCGNRGSNWMLWCSECESFDSYLWTNNFIVEPNNKNSAALTGDILSIAAT